MIEKSVLVRPQGLRPRARAPPCYATTPPSLTEVNAMYHLNILMYSNLSVIAF